MLPLLNIKEHIVGSYTLVTLSAGKCKLAEVIVIVVVRLERGLTRV